jgi:hypothetical protein
MAGRACRQDQRAGRRAGGEELRTGGGGGGARLPKTTKEKFRRVANVDALGTCRLICDLFVGKKWSMPGNSERCRDIVDVVGK